MTTKRMGDSSRASRNFAASLSLYSVGAQVRGLPAKNWTASQPICTPLAMAFQTPPDDFTCAPMYMRPSSLLRTLPRRASDEVPRRLVTPGLREDLPLIPVFALGDAHLVFNEERRRVAGHLPKGDDVETTAPAPARCRSRRPPGELVSQHRCARPGLTPRAHRPDCRGGQMDEDSVHRCSTCPAFAELPGEGGTGTCRSAPPVVLQAEKYFRGSSRGLPYGAYPAVGAFPLVRKEDYCMAHPKNRGLITR